LGWPFDVIAAARTPRQSLRLGGTPFAADAAAQVKGGQWTGQNLQRRLMGDLKSRLPHKFASVEKGWVGVNRCVSIEPNCARTNVCSSRIGVQTFVRQVAPVF
jgi:hypothetical protein